MQEYTNIFLDEEYPHFIDKYLDTKTLTRLRSITQFCGCDYTKIYTPKYLYTRYDHSLSVAHMTWHFTKDKKETIMALLHDVGTPCFAHCIDYVFGDYIDQESSEKKIVDVLALDEELLKCLEEDGLDLEDFIDDKNYPILENRSPKLCTDRLDGVLHTVYIWIHTRSIESIREVYDDLVVLKSEDGNPEIGFKTEKAALQFVEMVHDYAIELQSNEDKYVSNFIAEIISLAVQKNLLTIDDLYEKREVDVIEILRNNFISWTKFENAQRVERSEVKPDKFYISYKTKRRNVVPLVRIGDSAKRIDEISENAREIYDSYEKYEDSLYAYVDDIDTLE